MPRAIRTKVSLTITVALCVALLASAGSASGQAADPDPTDPVGTAVTSTSSLAPGPTTVPADGAAFRAEEPAPPNPTDTVQVSGVGTVSAVPDIMIVFLGVEVRGESVAVARTSAAQRAQAVITALRDAGVAADDVQTVRYSIQPQYRYPDNGAPVLESYVVANTVRAVVRDLATSGEVIDAAVAAGGDAATVSGVQFELADDAAALTGARQAAWADATSRASQLAALAGRTLGRVLSIEESMHAPTIGDPVARRASDLSTPIEAGTVDATVSIAVRFALS